MGWRMIREVIVCGLTGRNCIQTRDCEEAALNRDPYDTTPGCPHAESRFIDVLEKGMTNVFVVDAKTNRRMYGWTEKDTGHSKSCSERTSGERRRNNANVLQRLSKRI